MESSITKIGKSINMFYYSNPFNKDNEQLFIDKNGILVECQLPYVDDLDFNT